MSNHAQQSKAITVRSARLCRIGDYAEVDAGIPGPLSPAGEIAPDDMREVYEINVFGPVRVLHAALPLLEKSGAAVVVNVSSGLGSNTLATDPDSIASTFIPLVYASAKAALNMLTVQYAKAYPGMRINCVDPGFTATDFNNHRGTQAVEEGAEAIIAMAQIGADGPTGAFVDRAGTVPW
ncbi:hypothetical protein GCM10010435_00490 [Winogradskya consettensis]|uniref:Uncharacterized protein n=1 Tax=Winogradskya consettensis TaxID=113560 RepID=A0A919S7L7_9ACTN|nr:SDR family NAD(P)-dependent oxidoreductase [Actinoplanes consettensis]GIM66536.1 hypothetical protein Aco04nite_02460 [Actinoplanes consettensis]